MSIISVRNFLLNFFYPEIASNKLYQAVKEQRGRIIELKREYESLSKWNHQYVSTLSLLTEAMQALIWKKDEDHRYILANQLHCSIFFGYDDDSIKENRSCLVSIVGRTDEELIDENFTKHGIKNTFSETCIGSDNYASKIKGTSHFLEGGVIDETEKLFYSIKTPRFNEDGDFTGTIGMAWDVTKQSQFLVNQLNRWIYSKRVEKIYHKKDIFCYAITPQMEKCHIFHHICPFPERGKECTGRCEICDDKQGVINGKDNLGQCVQDEP